MSIDELRLHLLIDHTENDGYISDMLLAAVAMIEGPRGLGEALISRDWRLSLDNWPDQIVLPYRTTTSVNTITYLDSAGVQKTLAASNYAYDLDAYPVRIVPTPSATWPSTYPVPGAIKVTFTAGYTNAGQIPAQILAAIKLICGDLYANREGGLMLQGVGNQLTNPMLNALLEPFRHNAL